MDPTYINGLFVYPGAAVKCTPTWYFHLYTEPTCSIHIAQFKFPSLLQARAMNTSAFYCKGVPARIPNKTLSILRFFSCTFLNPKAKCVWAVPQITPRTAAFSNHYSFTHPLVGPLHDYTIYAICLWTENNLSTV
jgi:hypothetical protein